MQIWSLYFCVSYIFIYGLQDKVKQDIYLSMAYRIKFFSVSHNPLFSHIFLFFPHLLSLTQDTIEFTDHQSSDNISLYSSSTLAVPFL